MIYENFSNFWETLNNAGRIRLLSGILSSGGGGGLDGSLKTGLAITWHGEFDDYPTWEKQEVSPAYWHDNWIEFTAELIRAVSRDMEEDDTSPWEEILNPHA
jgi:hypothetical protein